MSGIRVALVTNALGPPTRGNGTTVHRWLGWLPEVDVHPTPVAPGFALPPGRLPDLVHGYHLLHGGLHAQALAKRHGLPLVLSLGGTDLYGLEEGGPEAPAMRRVLADAVLVTGAFPSFGERLGRLVEPPRPYAVVPRGVAVEDTPPARPRPDRLRVLLAAGIRAVKDPLLAVELAGRLVQAGLPAHLRIVGPVLDPAYDRQFRAVLADCPFAEHLEVPRAAMAACYAEADVVWNTSRHEGGPNAVLEALAAGCAVYARDVPGNRDLLVGAGTPGTLFSEAAEGLVSFHRALLHESAAERDARATTARAWLRRRHDSRAEAEALRAAYRLALGRA